jgi:hypothetical protein
MKEHYNIEKLSEIFTLMTKVTIKDKQAISNLICSFIDFAKHHIPEIPLNQNEIKVHLI